MSLAVATVRGVSYVTIRLERRTLDYESIALAWREAMAFDSRARLKEIKCPTLVIASSDDNAVPMHHAEMLHDGIAGSKLVVIEGADHALMWAHSDQWLEKVNKFLDS